MTSFDATKGRNMIQKIMSFLEVFEKKDFSKGEEEEESVRKLQKSFSDDWEQAATRNRAMREQIPKERKSNPVYSLGERRNSLVR